MIILQFKQILVFINKFFDMFYCLSIYSDSMFRFSNFV